MFRVQGGRCYYCNRMMWITYVQRDRVATALGLFAKSREVMGRMATVEHLVRRADGGGNDPDNLACACQQCNSMRHALPPKVWRQERWQHGI